MKHGWVLLPILVAVLLLAVESCHVVAQLPPGQTAWVPPGDWFEPPYETNALTTNFIAPVVTYSNLSLPWATGWVMYARWTVRPPCNWRIMESWNGTHWRQYYAQTNWFETYVALCDCSSLRTNVPQWVYRLQMLP